MRRTTATDDVAREACGTRGARRAAAAGLGAVLLLGACGGADDQDGDGAGTTAWPTAGPSESATAAEDEAATGSASAAPEAPTNAVASASEGPTDGSSADVVRGDVHEVRVLDVDGAEQTPGWVAPLAAAADEPLPGAWELVPGGRSGEAPASRALAPDGTVVGWDEGAGGPGTWNLFRHLPDGSTEHLVYELDGETDIGVADPEQTVVDDAAGGPGSIAWLARATDDSGAWRVMSLDPGAETATELVASEGTGIEATRIWLTDGVLVLADYDPEVGGHVVRPGETPSELPFELSTAGAWDAGSGHVVAVQDGGTDGLAVTALDVTDPSAEPRMIATLDLPDTVAVMSLVVAQDHVVLMVEDVSGAPVDNSSSGLLVLSLDDGRFVGGVIADSPLGGGVVAGEDLWVAAGDDEESAASGIYSVDLAGGTPLARSDFPANSLESSGLAVVANEVIPVHPRPALVWVEPVG
ncbi:hypothetical protein ACPYO6_15715 [Georgenia sp. Z1344]|uniref:hypothetical protein n=1 Tax=Georgenia sp. Z1344 TaxID=3416706 RepID=UPI003CF409E8